MASTTPKGLVITGPTATGKTDLSLSIAERLDAEIIAMDSRQVYRRMDLGTAKPTAAERATVPHHGLDLVEPGERYSAGRFAADARRWIEEIRGRGRVPILVGGTGFFLHALLHPLFEEPSMPGRARDRLRRFLGEQPVDRLRRWVETLDPAASEALAGYGGRQRLARVIEVALLTGRRLSWWHGHAPAVASPVPLLVLVLHMGRNELFERIDRRVDRMARAGLVQEVERLVEEGNRPGDPGMNATGYAELVPYLGGERALDAALDDIRRATRRYARRQLTWFRNQLGGSAFWLDAARPTDELAAQVVEHWHRALRGPAETREAS